MGIFFVSFPVAKLNPILFIDHDDSFSQNIVAYLRSRGAKVTVVNQSHRFDFFSDIKLQFAGIVLSPGPGHPTDYERSIRLYQIIPLDYPVFGVCLGMQIMMQAMGVNLTRMPGMPEHGRVIHLPDFRAVLYNSWGAKTTEPCLTENFVLESAFQGYAMAITRRTELNGTNSRKGGNHTAVQFHPESFRSVGAQIVMDHFLSNCLESYNSR